MSLRKLKRSRSKQSRKQLASKHGVSHPGELLRVAHQHLQAGKTGEAEQVFKQIIRAFPGNAAACNDLGILYHRQGKIDEAVSLYKKALAIDRNYPQALVNYGLVLLDRNDFSGAVELLRQALAINPQHTGALTNLGTALHKQGRLDEAVVACRRVLAVSPDDVYALNNLATIFRDQGEIEKAADLYQKVIGLYPDFIEARVGLGLVLKKQGRPDEAAASFEAALKVDSSQADLWKNLGIIYTEQEKFDKAVFAYEKVAKMLPDDFDTLTKLGILYQKRGDLDQAVLFFKKALEINPKFIAARFSLVEALEMYNKVEEAYAEALKGLEGAPADVSLLTIAAACERRLGEFQKALDRLVKVDDGNIDLSEQRQYFFEFGRVCDRAGEYDRAYDAFVSGNRASREINSRIDKNYFLSRIGTLRQQFSERAALPAGDPSLGGDSPVFLVGFPRSGTTLLDQVLDSHAKVQTMEEKDIVASLENDFVGSFEEYLPAWQALTPGKIKDLRRDYYQRADTYLDRQPGNILIDRMPLNIMRIALIWRIFPDAKFILAIRHPLDVCLSCFMQDFTINTANANFFTLEDGATFYGEVMALWQLYVDILPLNYHMVRYEDLVADLETEARRLYDFIGVEWDEKALKFHEHAKEKGQIKTASYHQVTQAIYQHAKYRWLRYEKYCGVIKENLASFIDYFGY